LLPLVEQVFFVMQSLLKYKKRNSSTGSEWQNLSLSSRACRRIKLNFYKFSVIKI